MEICTLISAMNADCRSLIQKMNIQTDAILINQCGHFGYEEFMEDGCLVKAYSFNEKGVGLSRNNALLRTGNEISLFSDDDIRYYDGYSEKIALEFKKHPEADLIFFNVDVCENRRTYYNHKWKRVRLLNSGRYPTYSLAARTSKLHQTCVTFSLLFGGGAKYSNGEDSLFIKNCLKAGLKAYASNEVIGLEEAGESTWFHGYNEKFFYDRGILYHYLYGEFALLFGFRFVYTKQKSICGEIPANKAFGLLKKGIREAEQ